MDLDCDNLNKSPNDVALQGKDLQSALCNNQKPIRCLITKTLAIDDKQKLLLTLSSKQKEKNVKSS